MEDVFSAKVGTAILTEVQVHIAKYSISDQTRGLYYLLDLLNVYNSYLHVNITVLRIYRLYKSLYHTLSLSLL
jgi:hypothetical protein